MDNGAKIFVAGHRGLVGSAIVRSLRRAGHDNLLLRTRNELDLCSQAAVAEFFRTERPRYVFMAAARVGGIYANNTYPAEFIHDNLVIQTNIIHQAYGCGVKKLLFLGSSCIYPKMAPQPLKEEYLLTGPLEPTNEPYAVAKIAGIKLCQSYNRQYGTCFLAGMPTNLYGTNDNFDPMNSHVLPALIRRFHDAKVSGAPQIVVWGSGTPLREFLHVDDVADASLFLMNLPEDKTAALLAAPFGPFVNICSGEEVTIRELALLIKGIVGFDGELVFDPGKPDGTPRKLSDPSRLHALGWRHRIGLEEGIRSTYQWYLENEAMLLHGKDRRDDQAPSGGIS
jgi:GDP-L-fucose synthase